MCANLCIPLLQQNVLLVENAKSLSGDFLMRVADFGLSTSVKKDPGGGFAQNKTICGTPLFMVSFQVFMRMMYRITCHC